MVKDHKQSTILKTSGRSSCVQMFFFVWGRHLNIFSLIGNELTVYLSREKFPGAFRII